MKHPNKNKASYRKTAKAIKKSAAKGSTMDRSMSLTAPKNKRQSARATKGKSYKTIAGTKMKARKKK